MKRWLVLEGQGAPQADTEHEKAVRKSRFWIVRPTDPRERPTSLASRFICLEGGKLGDDAR